MYSLVSDIKLDKSTKTLIVIAGATASGKTSLAIEVAQKYGAEIISADSRQFYRQMSIGTAVPSEEELSQACHHLIHSHDVWEDYSAGSFEKDALPLLDELFTRSDYAVLVGGSGLYIDALCRGFDDIPEVDGVVREELNTMYQNEGLEPLLVKLKELDECFYNTVDRANHKRVIRALEVCITTGKPYSDERKGEGKKRDFNIVRYAIDMPREVLYDRINRRVDIMMEQGLEQEARSVLKYRDCNSLQTVGYRELFDYFDEVITLDRAVELIKQNSRRYAKRQLTWLRRDDSIIWVGGSGDINL